MEHDSKESDSCTDWPARIRRLMEAANVDAAGLAWTIGRDVPRIESWLSGRSIPTYHLDLTLIREAERDFGVTREERP